ncbi:MAG: hypothetical protein N2316_09835 [Spirochaetes bacterium]|nr:hypothetical protein [Spirochaetota bacterium]
MKEKFFAFFFLFLCIGLGHISEGWIFDHGLETEIDEMKKLFRKRDLLTFYFRHVDPVSQMETEQLIMQMVKDEKNGPEIARRLHFPNYQSLKKALPKKIVEHFFLAMKNPPERKAPLIRNVEYLKIAYRLTMLFAPFDDGMKVVEKKIGREKAELVVRCERMKLVAYFVLRNGKWYITNNNQ